MFSRAELDLFINFILLNDASALGPKDALGPYELLTAADPCFDNFFRPSLDGFLPSLVPNFVNELPKEVLDFSEASLFKKVSLKTIGSL